MAYPSLAIEERTGQPAAALIATGPVTNSLRWLDDALARGGPNCFQCHFYRGVPPLDGEALPIAWAPDLSRVHERIREDWAHQWIKDPARIYPGTAMPANFELTL